jgi:type IV pilus assembly protein PilC
MPTYTCLVRDGATTTSTNVLAQSLPQAVQELREKGVEVLSVRAAADAAPRRRRRSEFYLTIFLRQLASALRAGLSLPDSLRLIAQEAPLPRVQRAALQLSHSLAHGESFSSAAGMEHELFDDTTVALLKAGERSGALDEIVEDVAAFRERSATLARQLASVFVYPAVVSTVALIIVSAMFTYLIPKQMEILKEFKVDMPNATQFVWWLSRWFAPMLLLLTAGVAALCAMVSYYRAMRGYNLLIGYWQIRLPLIGRMYYDAAMSRLLGMLAILLRHGVPLPDALNLAGESSGNAITENGMRVAANLVSSGETLSDALKSAQVLPPLVVSRIAVAERSHDMPDALQNMSRLYAHQAELSARTIISFIEPMLIICVGVAIAFIIASVYLPFLSVINVLSQ